MASLYVDNLNSECTEIVLYQKFAPFGSILNIRLGKDIKTRRCSGYGYINYVNKVDAQSAMSKLNHTMLQGNVMRIMWVFKDIKKLPPDANIFLKNLVSHIDERTLFDIFGNYGSIFSIKLVRDEEGVSKGYGFIQFEEAKSAEDAIKEVDGKILHGKVVHVSKFMPQDKRLKSNELMFNNVYFKNFNSELSDDDLVKMCKKFGEIASAKVMIDEEGNSRCFGFVSFKNSDSAKEAVKELHGTMLNGRRLFADRAKKKLERQKEIKENFKSTLEEIEESCIQPAKVNVDSCED